MRFTALQNAIPALSGALVSKLAVRLLCFLCVAALSLYSQTSSTPSARTGNNSAPASQTVITVDVDGVVHPITVEILRHAIAQAEESGAAAVLLRLNTPGGMMNAM